MMNKFFGAVGALAVLSALPAAAQSRTPWQMHNGNEVTASNPRGLVQFNCAPSRHGDICEYNVSSIPAASDPDWAAAPNGETIAFDIPSRVCQAPVSCMAYGDFTYFQSFVSVPSNVQVTTFTIAFNGMDDGSRVTIFNSHHPGGLVIPGSYVYLGGSGTANLASYVVPGEINRVVITQVDDCCSENRLHSAAVVLNGEVVDSACQTPADCDDGNSCTTDVCNTDGTCTSALLACVGGEECNGNPNVTSGSNDMSTSACTPGSGGPTLVVNGDLNMTLECGETTWTDPDAQAYDADCSSIPVHHYNSGHDAYGPGPATCAEGLYHVQYIAWNAMGQTVSAVRAVTVNDTKPPRFALKGPTHMVHQCGSQWAEPGWTAFDTCYGDITPEVQWTGFPNGWVEGVYTVNYTLTDSGGNSAPSLTRTVEVVNCPW
ncbi:DUF5011 domain-containing protein [Hyalangium rubrum]|uniref:DUF5011 domain-containing protein n=1 Tax=Hyalangium rubrum TaxID=3103134 RepID=A0ABU5HDM4_9BACT|nr:DUF5011 domain-containing protein [Hyalangium sp. s54d21]MDY7230969.1 DUF5011 domain-containing protein [Hyalangium sp. s54d21]